MQNDVGIYNPLSLDFSCKHADFGILTIPSREIAYFKPEIADFVKRKLITEIINDRGLNGIELNADPKKKQAILDEINVEKIK